MGFLGKSLTTKEKNVFIKREEKKLAAKAKVEKTNRRYSELKNPRYSNFKKNLASISDNSFNKVSGASTRLASGIGGIRPRVQNNSNLSRQVLDDSYKLNTDITRKS
jgi:hypothetical protein